MVNSKVQVNYAGTITVSTNNSPLPLWPHQQAAMAAMTAKIPVNTKRKFAGLLVIPTGGGKTMIAIRWLLRNLIDRGKKVLWIAHRHELLEQAFLTAKNNACKDGVLSTAKTFRYRIISGQHGKSVHVQPNDDIVIASKDSLNKGITHLLKKWLEPDEEVFLVIDEAHHATAKTYRALVDKLSDGRVLKMLGLTATPFRTLEKEKGLLGKVFFDDIVYKIDLRSLIAQGILAEPTFETLETKLNFAKSLTEEDVKTIAAFDKLPEQIATQIAASNQRNAQIVSRYVEKHAEYGQLLVFAVNVAHAISLNAIFNAELNKRFKTKGKEYSDYVVGDIVDKATGVRISSAESKAKIEAFRRGERRVLINVQILTEGTDLPNAKTVFLTRPTMSTVLMTQMIGRVLRGEKAGGKGKAFVVSFIDNWEDKISWVSPEKLCIEKSAEFIDSRAKSSNNIIQLIAVEKIEEFSRMMHEQVPELERLDFLARIPVGIYSFSVLISEELDKNCEVLVFDHMRQAFSNFIDAIPELFRVAKVTEHDELDEADLQRVFTLALDEYFVGHDAMPRYRDDDIKDILRYYAQTGAVPKFLEFKDRAQYDVGREARHIFENLPTKEWARRQNELWDDKNGFWQVLFGHRREFFVRQLSIEIEKLIHPPRPTNGEEVVVGPDEVDIAELPLWEIRKRDPGHWRRLHDKVFAKHTAANGIISCGNPDCDSGHGDTRLKSKHKILFQIDHIRPMEKGGLSVVENLQVLCRGCNAKKSDKDGGPLRPSGEDASQGATGQESASNEARSGVEEVSILGGADLTFDCNTLLLSMCAQDPPSSDQTQTTRHGSRVRRKKQ